VLADTIADMSEEELEALAPTLKNGVFMGSAVFDGARETEIQGIAFERGPATSGQDELARWHDGEIFEQPSRSATSTC